MYDLSQNRQDNQREVGWNRETGIHFLIDKMVADDRERVNHHLISKMVSDARER